MTPSSRGCLRRHGMPAPEIYDYPVHAVYWPGSS